MSDHYEVIPSIALCTVDLFSRSTSSQVYTCPSAAIIPWIVVDLCLHSQHLTVVLCILFIARLDQSAYEVHQQRELEIKLPLRVLGFPA